MLDIDNVASWISISFVQYQMDHITRHAKLSLKNYQTKVTHNEVSGIWFILFTALVKKLDSWQSEPTNLSK